MKTSSLVTTGILVIASADAFAHYANALKRSGKLSSEDAAKLDAIERDPRAAEDIILEEQGRSEQYPRRDPNAATSSSGSLLDLLPLGGGLLNGILQPLSGALEAIDIPTPQPFGLKKIPGDEPNHQFQKPGPTDVRGMCPTLNALANHGYISRDGISSFAEVANACQTGFGLGYDVSVLLSAFALAAGGDLISGKYSIGGQDDRVPNTLGLAPGLDSHGVFEIDTSITRQDTHWGNNANFINDRWLQYVALADKHGGQFNFDANVEDASNRYDTSRKYNPSFLAGFLWFFVTHVERVFVFSLLPNGTNEGVADYANVAPFFLNETFPPNWYRRATPWNAVQNFGTAAEMFLAAPRELGANVGTGNFIPLGANLTAQTPEDITCFITMNLLDLIPAQLQQPALLGNQDLFQAFWKGVVWPFFVNDGHYNCPIQEFTGPSQSAGVKGNVYSASGSPVNGKYDGLGYIAPDGLS
ncbi:hypothetical protein M409DRAFT_48753 [Zasmidium cellare ATCC 36951]|uniref:Heme haloperoxidase family profile domain-containing protein n=1 Tax=Zasmidium cellare ATCC 36951 TaxID=1080233 RepID=A0A6A6D3Y6_ZASCE|nr:uncharacterized protein M409DRAFT_48753 [Zasmidium cellare ATCC 36951]KAF2173833.1 hypothetical protein M409DRAFT_48753 [Zasmidium cellare ATCC 36951]